MNAVYRRIVLRVFSAIRTISDDGVFIISGMTLTVKLFWRFRPDEAMVIKTLEKTTCLKCEKCKIICMLFPILRYIAKIKLQNNIDLLQIIVEICVVTS